MLLFYASSSCAVVVDVMTSSCASDVTSVSESTRWKLLAFSPAHTHTNTQTDRQTDRHIDVHIEDVGR